MINCMNHLATSTRFLHLIIILFYMTLMQPQAIIVIEDIFIIIHIITLFVVYQQAIDSLRATTH